MIQGGRFFMAVNFFATGHVWIPLKGFDQDVDVA